jgi:hypothetical protein
MEAIDLTSATGKERIAPLQGFFISFSVVKS